MDAELGPDGFRRVPVDIAPGLSVTVLEARDAEELISTALLEPGAEPYGGVLWPAAVAVARELPGRIRPGSSLVDVGAGTGLVALTAAFLGARAIALDRNATALRLVEAAARIQGLDVATRPFDVLSDEPLPPGDTFAFADLLYDRDLARAVARRVGEVVERGARAVVGDPGRFARFDFSRGVEKTGLQPRFRTVQAGTPGDDRTVPVGVAWFGADEGG